VLNSGDTAWVLASAALVMLMTPGLAFFYGGMVRSKSVLNMLMMNFIALAVVGTLWFFYGFSFAFANDATGAGLIGNLDFVGLENTVGHLAGFAVAANPATGTQAVPWPGPDAIPVLAFCMFQLMFAVITPALISGAVADRLKFWSWTLFVALWVTIVYFPVAHWVFSFDGFVGADAIGGWIANPSKLGALDFAGGTAVHINAGAAGLALAIVLGRRKGWPKEPMRPHNVPHVLLGASLLWFGGSGSTRARRSRPVTSRALPSPTR
jgi:Amt family ammonium transporter